MNYFLAYDVGTSSVKAILVDAAGQICGAAVEEYPLYMPNPGWVEQDPEEYWQAICKATQRIVEASGISKENIKALAFSTQAMGIIPVTKEGTVLHRNITWVDGRAEEQALKAMRRFGSKAIFKAIVGIELTGKDVIPKLMWLKEKRSDIFQQTHKFLDVNGYLKYRCTGKMVAEWSGACSYAFNLKKKDWERIFFKITGVGTAKLPDLVRSVDHVGNLTEDASAAMGLHTGVAVYGGCDDTQAAAVGTTALGEGEAHIYTGTSAWVGVMTGKEHGFKNGAFCLQSADPTRNLVVGITESAGVNTEWLINSFYSNEKVSLSAEDMFSLLEKDIAGTPPGAEFLLMTPWFLGERCPVSTTTTRSTIFNLTHHHTRAHITRAHFEGIAFNLRWAIANFEKDFGFSINELKVTGGGSRNRAWMQIIADVTGKKIVTTSQALNAGALGAAMCAMVGSGTLKDFEEIHALIQPSETFLPDTAHAEVYGQLFSQYRAVYQQLKIAYREINKDRF
jgi:xylulokinase